MSDILFTPIIFYILWLASLYLFLTVIRAPSVWGVGLNEQGVNPFAEYERRVSANLSNQFEWPILFYIVSILLILRPDLYHVLHYWLAWLFVLGRVLHSIVQIFTKNIRLRGVIFIVNFLAVLCMWGVLVSLLP